jgi:tetratricopeptide (TPR) repeat protein
MLDPKNTQVFNYRGLSYQFLGKNDLAINDFTIAIELEPKFENALLNRANSYIDINKKQDAILDCKNLLKLNPNNKDAKFLLLLLQR